MATGDLTVANGVMKIVGGKLTKQYEESALLHNRIAKGRGTKISDRGVEIPTHLAGNYNHTFMTDGGDFPAGGSNNVKRAQVFFKNFAFSVRLSGAAVDAINSLDVAYIKDWLQFNLDESMKAAYKMSNIYAFGKGDSRLATISSGANSTTQTVGSPDFVRYLKNGLLIDIISSDGTTIRGTQTITSSPTPGSTATTFTLDAAINSSTNDLVVPSGAFNLGFTGLKAMVDDTTNAPVTFQGLSRNTFLGYRAVLVAAAAVGLDVSFLRRVLSAGVHINVGEIDRDALEIWSHPAQTSAYSNLGWNLKRADMKSKSIDLGYTVYEYEGINWVEDVDCWKDKVYFLDWSTFGKFIAKDYGWDDKTGSILRQVPSSTTGIAYKDQYEAYMTARHNYGNYRPNKNGVVDNLAIPTGF